MKLMSRAAAAAGEITRYYSLKNGCAAGLPDVLAGTVRVLPPCFEKEYRALLNAAAENDAFSASDEFERRRRDYSGCSAVLTFDRLLCLIWETGATRETAAALEMLSAVILRADNDPFAADPSPVWLRFPEIIRSGEPGKKDDALKILIAVHSCAGNSRRNANIKKTTEQLLSALSEKGADREKYIINAMDLPLDGCREKLRLRLVQIVTGG